MLETLKSATNEVFQTAFGVDISTIDKLVSAGYITDIELKSGNVEYISFVFEETLLKEIAELLGTGKSNEEISDLACELTNLIAGKAKVTLLTNGRECMMGTPNFLGTKENPHGYADVSFSTKDGAFTITLGKNRG